MSGLTERYVAAAIRTLPPETQTDVRTELEASIADAVEARVDAGEPVRDAEHAVITDLGDPDVLAADYVDRPLRLIGPRYYLTWWRLLKLLWWIVIPVAMVGNAIAQVIAHLDTTGLDATSAMIGEIIGGAIAVGIAAGVHVGFWTTLVFAILERTGADTGMRWSPDQLPEPSGDGSGRGELIGSLVTAGIFVGALVWDRLVGFSRTPDAWVPVLDPALWPWGMGWVFGTLGATALIAIAVYATGRWTYRLATCNAIVCAAFAVPAFVAIVTGSLLNPAFVDAFLSEPAHAGTMIALAIVVPGIAIWSAIDAFQKARRAG